MPETRFLAGSRGRISGHDVTKYYCYLCYLKPHVMTCWLIVPVDPYEDNLVVGSSWYLLVNRAS